MRAEVEVEGARCCSSAASPERPGERLGVLRRAFPGREQNAEADLDDRGVELRAGTLEQAPAASSTGSASRYGRVVVMAWKASQTKMIRASSGISSPRRPSGYPSPS